MRGNPDNHIVIPHIGRNVKGCQFTLAGAQNDFGINLFPAAVITVFRGRPNNQICFQTFFFAALADIKARLPSVGNYKRPLGYQDDIRLLGQEFL